MSFGLSDDLISKFHCIFKNYSSINEVIIYGSRAKGNYREGSDIDLTLKGDNITEEIRSKLFLDLDDLNTLYLIDLSIYHTLSSPSLKDHIDRIGKILYKKSN